MKSKFLIFILLLVLSLAVSGCTDQETTTVQDDEGNDVDITYTEGSEDEVCPVGSTVTMNNPNTGESMVMEVMGTEVIDGMEMCYMVAEINTEDEEVSRMEMYTPINEDDESFIMTYYDEDGNVLSEMKFMDGKMTMTDENGETFEMTMGMEQ
jgi:hypothetical protein